MNDRAKTARGARSVAAVATLPELASTRTPIGFALFDVNLRLAAWNASFASLRDYPRRLIKAGTPLDVFVRFDAERGEYGAGALDALVRRQVALMKRRRRTDRDQALPDGRCLHLASERLPEGVLLLTCKDVTERNALERRINEQAAVVARTVDEITVAHAEQTATSEILRAIARSPADLQQVLDTALRNAARLCEASNGSLFRVEGDRIRRVAAYGSVTTNLRVGESRALGRGSLSGRAIVDRQTLHIHDLHKIDLTKEYPDVKQGIERQGIRTCLATPLIREGEPIGAFTIYRTETRPFTAQQIELVKTFADQAVIAIENVRLFNETQEALDQLKASTEVLQVISSSVANTKPVFDKILESCQRLFEGLNVGINLVGEDGALCLGAYQGPNREELVGYSVPLSDDSGSGAAILQRRVVHYPNLTGGANVPEYVKRGARMFGYKSIIIAPMLWEGRGIGTIFVGRDTVGEFSEKEIGLLKTFADQAVIAIQNARLFHEIEEKSHQLEIANQHKSAFLANMSHELRTPLNAVIGFSEMLAARYFGSLTEKQAEYVSDIHASGKHLLSLINDILDLSKIEAGRMELENSDFDLPAALGNAFTLVRERAQRHGIGIESRIDPVLGAFRGDERKVKQIVLNLLSNAVKFTPAGGSVTLDASGDSDAVRIAVSDTGVGIAREDQEAIFEAFRQVGSDVIRKRDGTGLGLALTRRFVELHSGTIRVESQPCKGSIFTVTLPIRHGE